MKKNRFSLSIAAALFLTTPLALAEGGNSSGGGGSVVCFQSAQSLTKIRNQKGKLQDEDIADIVQIEAYDLFQAKLPRSIDSTETKIFAITPGEDTASYMQRLAGRFDYTVPVVSDMLRAALKSYQAAQILYAPHGVAQLDDAAQVVGIDESRCALITTAHQYTQGNQLFVAFDQRLMRHPLHSELSRLVLSVHEAIYASARVAGHRNSLPTRDLLSAILPASIERTAGSLLELYDGLGFPRAKQDPGLALSRLARFIVASTLQKQNELLETFNQTNKEIHAVLHKESNSMPWIDDGLQTYPNRRKLDQLCQESRFSEFFAMRARWISSQLNAYWVANQATYLNPKIVDPRVVTALTTWFSGVALELTPEKSSKTKGDACNRLVGSSDSESISVEGYTEGTMRSIALPTDGKAADI